MAHEWCQGSYPKARGFHYKLEVLAKLEQRGTLTLGKEILTAMDVKTYTVQGVQCTLNKHIGRQTEVSSNTPNAGILPGR